MIDESFYETEEYIMLEEQYMIDWKKKYDSKLKEAESLMNRCLATKELDDLQKLMEFFEDEELVKELSEDNKFMFMVVMMNILYIELDENIKYSIIEWADNLERIIAIIRQIKFLLWEIEFLDSQESMTLLFEFLKDMNISMSAFEYIVYITSYDKEKIVKHIQDYLNK